VATAAKRTSVDRLIAITVAMPMSRASRYG